LWKETAMSINLSGPEKFKWPLKSTKSGFTLIELLVVIAIIALLAAILFPVFASAREKARQANCESNLKQIALGLMQYTQDFDEQLPGATVTTTDPGMGWISQAGGYFGGSYGSKSGGNNSADVFLCPDDQTQADGTYVVQSYALNANTVALDKYDPNQFVQTSQFTAPAKSVLLFEILGSWYAPGAPTDHTSIAGDGHYLFGGVTYYSRYATGYLGAQGQPTSSGSCSDWYNGDAANAAAGGCAGATTYSPGGMGATAPFSNTGYLAPAVGRHNGGSNFAFCDGHVKWLQGNKVSAWGNAEYPTCNENNVPAVTGCSAMGTTSAGTSGNINGVPAAATFSIY